MKEQEAVVTATIKLQFRVCGDLVKALQNCWYDEADQIAKSLADTLMWILVGASTIL